MSTTTGVQVPQIKAIIVTDGDGKRIAAKYYGTPATGSTDALSSSKPFSSTPLSIIPPSSSSSSSSSINNPSGDLLDPKNQSLFEKKIFQKTARTNARIDAEMLLFEKYLLVYRFHADVFIYILGDAEENELVLLSILSALEESLNLLLRGTINKKSLLDNFDLLLLTIDEIIDDGNLLELDSSNLLSRVAMKTGGGGGGGSNEAVPLSEQTFTQALQTAKDQLVKSFR